MQTKAELEDLIEKVGKDPDDILWCPVCLKKHKQEILKSVLKAVENYKGNDLLIEKVIYSSIENILGNSDLLPKREIKLPKVYVDRYGESDLIDLIEYANREDYFVRDIQLCDECGYEKVISTKFTKIREPFYEPLF